MAQVKIEESLFYKLLSYHCYPEALEELELEALGNMISKQLESKLDDIVKRNSYSTYKTGATAEEREAARQKYLDMRGIKPEFRY